MKRKTSGCILLFFGASLLVFIACGFDYSQYDAEMSYKGPWVGVEFSSEWGTRVPYQAGMTLLDAVKTAVEDQIRIGSSAEPLRRRLGAIDSARLLRRHPWSSRRAIARMAIIPILVDSPLLFDDEALEGPKSSWLLQPGDYVTFEPRP
jgi:hypothetical protein